MENLDKDTAIFKKTSFADISENIYKSSKQRSILANSIINQLTSLIKTPTDATFVVPLLKDLLDTDIKNADIQVKLANIIQRMISTTTKVNEGGGGAFDLSEFEDLKLELGEGLEELKQEIESEEDQELIKQKEKIESELEKLNNE